MAAPLAWSTWRNAWQAAQEKRRGDKSWDHSQKATVGSGHGGIELATTGPSTEAKSAEGLGSFAGTHGPCTGRIDRSTSGGPSAGPVTKSRLVSPLALDATLLAAMLAVVAAGPEPLDSGAVSYRHSDPLHRCTNLVISSCRNDIRDRSGEPFDGWPLVVKKPPDHAKADCSEARPTPGPLIAPSTDDNSD